MEITLKVDDEALVPTMSGPVMVMLPGPKVTGPPWVVDCPLCWMVSVVVVATPSIRRNREGSRGLSVVVMETAEHWNRDDLAGVVVVHRATRDPLPIP